MWKREEIVEVGGRWLIVEVGGRWLIQKYVAALKVAASAACPYGNSRLETM